VAVLAASLSDLAELDCGGGGVLHETLVRPLDASVGAAADEAYDANDAGEEASGGGGG